MLLAAIGYPDLSQSDFDRIQSVRAQYDIANYNLIKPHITIVVCDKEQEYKRIADELEKSHFSIKGQISTIDVITLNNNQVETIWKIELISKKS